MQKAKQIVNTIATWILAILVGSAVVAGLLGVGLALIMAAWRGGVWAMVILGVALLALVAKGLTQPEDEEEQDMYGGFRQ